MAEARRRIPTVVITAHDSPEARARVMAGGASAYLRKPVDGRMLMDAIRLAVAGGPAAGGKSGAAGEP